MVKSSKKVKKLLCLFLIVCLASSMILTSQLSVQAQAGSPTPLQKVILQALDLSSTDRKAFVTNVLQHDFTTNYDGLYAAAEEYLPDMNNPDMKTAYDSYIALNGTQELAVQQVIRGGFSDGLENVDTSSFTDVAKKINHMVTGNENDIKGFKFTVTVMDNIANMTDILGFGSESVVSDLDGQTGKICFSYSNTTVKGILNPLFGSVDNLPQNINDMDSFLSAAQNALNGLNNDSQIVAFKYFLITDYPKTYKRTTSSLQKVIIEALSMSPDKREDFVTDVLNKNLTLPDPVTTVQSNYFTMSETDILKAFDVYNKLADKSIVDNMIRGGFYTNEVVDTSAFKGVEEKINHMVTGNSIDKRGFLFTVTLMKKIAILGDTVASDLNGQAGKISFSYNGIYKGKLDPLFSFIGSFPTTSPAIISVDTFLTAAQNALNNLNKDTQIIAFKNYLKGVNLDIYHGSLNPTAAPTTAPTSIVVPSSNPSTIVATSTPTQAPTATSTSTVAPTPTPTADVKPGDKVITSFSFKGLNPEAKGVVFERLRTIIVKVPLKTNLKNLVPTIEYKGASIKPESGDKKNFSHPVFYTVTAKDKTKARYVVIVVFGTNNIVEEPQEVRPGAGPYGDIFGHWAEDNLIGLIECGVLTGYPDGSIKPNSDMTRAEVVTLIMKALGISPAQAPKFNFKDSKNIPSWAQGYFKTALDKVFIQGYPDNTLKPTAKVTRSEFTVMVMKAFGLGDSKTFDLKFKDGKNVIPDWAKAYIAKAVELKIINGYSDNTFRPNSFITRAEVGAIIDRCITASGKTYPEL